MEKRKVIYYRDLLHDEFSTAVIRAKKIDDSYVYDHKGPLWAIHRFFWYRAVATPLAYLYVKLSLRQKTVGREKWKPYGKTGFYIYGNHTQQVGDPLTPNVFLFPKNVSFIVHPNNVSMPVLGRINPVLGAVPLPDTMGAYRRFLACVRDRIRRGHAVVIYPEAHIWPYYTKIRPFPDDSFTYPAKGNTPVFSFVNTYQRGKGRRVRMITYIDGPFLPDASLSLAARKKDLRDRVYKAMCERAKLSDVEVIQYLPAEDGGKEG